MIGLSCKMFTKMYALQIIRGCRRRAHFVVGFKITCAVSAFHHYSCEFEPCSWRGVLDTTLCDKICQWFYPGTPVSSTNKTDRHDITEILLKVALYTINQAKPNLQSLSTVNINSRKTLKQTVQQEMTSIRKTSRRS